MYTRHKNARGKGIVGTAIMVALTMIVFVPTMARADILAMGANPNPVVYGDGAAHPLPINGGAPFLNFTTTVPNQKVAVLFNAECAVKSADVVSYVDAVVLIDGAPALPSGSNNAFCTSTGRNVLTRGVRASTNVIRIVPNPGVHNVRVIAILKNFSGGEAFRIDDISVIVLK
ncbi:MAG: hypothetical protein NT022_01455 [Deltaproteobacteria bacterium]|nr:hypothetical protein [Deltaproteobacteria bacterium]